MAGLNRFRSQAFRINRSQISLLLRSSRLFFSSSSDSPPTETEPSADTKQPVNDPVEGVELTREDVRYFKDESVSIEKKVAPLPEYTAASEDGDLNAEGRRIVADSQVNRRTFMAVEEEKPLPFPTLIKMERRPKKKIYDLLDAIHEIKVNSRRNFDETVEAHVNLKIDPRRSDLAVNGSVVLPHGSGKVVRIAVFAEGAAAEEARAAGAEVVGGNELIKEINDGSKLNFDKCIATLSMMQRVVSISKILRSLTPNAKRGTVTDDVAAAVKLAKQGLIDFKMKDSIVHVALGKVSFTEEALRENIGAFINALLLAKPPGLKKSSKFAGYVKGFHLCSTMSPGYQVGIDSLSKVVDRNSKSQKAYHKGNVL